MHWHIDTDIVCLVLLCLLLAYSYKAFAHGNVRGKYFLACVIACMAALVADIAGSIIMEVPTAPVLYHIIMTLYFTLVLTPMVLWIMYTASIIYEQERKRYRRVTRICKIFLGVYAAGVCTNPWTGIIYRLGPGNLYQRGPLFFILLLLYALCSLSVIVLVLVRGARAGTPGLRAILIVLPVIQGAGIAIQLSVPGWLMILPAYTIAIFAAYLFLQNTRNEEEVQELSLAAITEGMTGLLNKVAGERRMEAALQRNAGKTAAFFLVDLDDLKAINDRYGHYQGDRAICAVAAVLKRSFRSGDIITRVGGDEFGVFLPDISDRDVVAAKAGELVEDLARLRVGERDEVEIHGSVGIAIISGVHRFDEVYKEADKALYHVKATQKGTCAFYEPWME